MRPRSTSRASPGASSWSCGPSSSHSLRRARYIRIDRAAQLMFQVLLLAEVPYPRLTALNARRTTPSPIARSATSDSLLTSRRRSFINHGLPRGLRTLRHRHRQPFILPDPTHPILLPFDLTTASRSAGGNEDSHQNRQGLERIYPTLTDAYIRIAASPTPCTQGRIKIPPQECLRSTRRGNKLAALLRKINPDASYTSCLAPSILSTPTKLPNMPPGAKFLKESPSGHARTPVCKSPLAQPDHAS